MSYLLTDLEARVEGVCILVVRRYRCDIGDALESGGNCVEDLRKHWRKRLGRPNRGDKALVRSVVVQRVVPEIGCGRLIENPGIHTDDGFGRDTPGNPEPRREICLGSTKTLRIGKRL